MKKALLATTLLAAVVLSTSAFAASKTAGFWFDTQSSPVAGSQILDLTTQGSWTVWYTGSATVSPTTAVATLSGNNDGRVWKYDYSTDGTNWTNIGTLISTFSGTPNSVGNSKTEDAGPIVVNARYLRLGYDVGLTSLGNASASGSGSITAEAVPEPSSLLGLGALIAPLGAMLRRKRA